jgi:hypothetical protein
MALHYGVLPLQNGGLVVGNTRSFQGTRYDAWIVRLTRSGARLWHRALGGPYTHQVYAVGEAPGGGILVASHTRSRGAGRSDFWVVRLDLKGRLIWQRVLGGAGEDRARTLLAMQDGGVVAGASRGPRARWDATLG